LLVVEQGGLPQLGGNAVSVTLKPGGLTLVEPALSRWGALAVQPRRGLRQGRDGMIPIHCPR